MTTVTSRMRFRPRRLLKVVTTVILIWLVVTLAQYLLSGEEEEEIKLEFPEPDTHIPDSFLRSPEGTTTPVVIVEEHYEVLKYWFAAAESGLIPATGNVLLHIDGHGDLGIPAFIHNLPLFRAPRNIQEVSNMMQRNDVFVVAAALTGLIDRYIWVWPPWDEPNHDQDHITVDVELGTVVPSSATSPVEVCMCFEIHGSDHTECRMRNSTDFEGDGILIDISQCSLNISGTLEIVSEQEAMLLLQSEEWITSRHNVILDIDEDYYGCESAGTPLYSAGITSGLLKTLTEIFSLLFCARNVQHENQCDTFFHSILQLIIKLRTEVEQNQKMSKKARYLAVQQVLYSLLTEIYQEVKQGPLRSILCSDPEDPAIELLLQGVIRHTANLNLTQLTSLAEAGLCLQFSPKASVYDVSESLQVCEGKEPPDSKLLTFHTPTPFEIHERTVNLRKMLRSKFLKPLLVTLTRSVRDGFTPRKLFPRIEADILKLLHEVFPDVHYASFYHDADLLGAISGWHGRSFSFKNTFVYKIFEKHLPDIREHWFPNI